MEHDTSDIICDVPQDVVPLGMPRRVILLCLGTLLSFISIFSTILFQQISKKDNNLRQRGRYLVTLQGYFSSVFLFVICFYQAYKCRVPCAFLFWGAYLGLVPFVLVFAGRAWRLITRFDRNNAIYQSRFAEPTDLNNIPPTQKEASPSSSNFSTLPSLSDSYLEQEKTPQSSSPNTAPVVSDAWYNRYRAVTDKQMLALAIIFMLFSTAIGVAFQFTIDGIALDPIKYKCHSGIEYIWPYSVAVSFLFGFSPFMVFQLRGINDGFGIRNELKFLSMFSFPCFICFFLLPHAALEFSRDIVDRTTWIGLILIASHVRAILFPLFRHFKAYPHQCAYTVRRRQRKVDQENAKRQAEGSTLEENPTLPTHLPTAHVHSGGVDLDQLAMEEFGPDYHARKGSVTNINNTIRNLIRNQRKQRFGVGTTSGQGSTIDTQKTDWDAFLRVLENKQLFDRLSAFTVREFCAENTRFLYEVSRLERRAVQYEKLRDLSLTPSGVPSTIAEELVPQKAQLSKSPSTSTTHSILPPLPAHFSNEVPHRIKKIISASSVGSSAPMLRTRRSSLSYVDDSEPPSPMASSSISTFMRYGSTSALPDLEEGISTYKSEVKSKSEGQLEIVGLQEIAPLPMPPTLLIQFEYIYKNFISLGGRLELNLSHDTLQDLHCKARRVDWHSGMFDGAVYEIQELLFRDVWPKFVSSSQGLHYAASTDDHDRVQGDGGSTRSVAGVSRTSVFTPFEQPPPQAQASSARTTPSPSIHMVSPKSSMSAATSSRVAASLSDSVSVGRTGSGKSRREDEFHEEPSKSGFRTWLSKKSRTGITAATLMSREGRNEESLGIIEQSRKSSADRRSDTSGLYSSSIQNSLAKST